VQALEESLSQLPQLVQLLTPEQQDQFFELLARSLQGNAELTAKEKRSLRRSLTRKLEDYNIEDARFIADTLADMEIEGEIDFLLPLLQTAHSIWIIELAYNLTCLQSNARNILTAVERASKVVFALKSYARYDASGQKQLASLSEGIDTVLELYRNQMKQGIEVIRRDRDLPLFLCYPDELMQVWTNLIHNAIQAMRSHLRGLRQKLKAAGAPKNFIETVYGLGYRLKSFGSEAEPATETPPPPQPQKASRQAKHLKMLAKAWKEHKQTSLDHLNLLAETAVTAEKGALNANSQDRARRAAHSLAGTLGTFGFAEGSRLARELEHLLQADFPLKASQVPVFKALVMAIALSWDKLGKLLNRG